jgi:hypothetical protein
MLDFASGPLQPGRDPGSGTGERTEYIIQEVVQGLNLLEQFHDEVDELSLSELSKRLSLNEGSVTLLLSTLKSRNCLEQNGSAKKYRFCVMNLELGQTVLRQTDLYCVSRPVLALASGTSLSGISVKVLLPPGVTVSADSANVVPAGVVTASGVAAVSRVIPAIYTPATASAPATLEFVVFSNAAGGFGVGEFATVNCQIVSGSFPTASSFVLPAADFKPADLLLQPVTGLTATLTAAIS